MHFHACPRKWRYVTAIHMSYLSLLFQDSLSLVR
jgi:hypothetical protein